MAAPIALKSPEELVASVPYLLGHHPQRSLVAITTSRVNGSTNIALISRTDLQDLTTHGVDALRDTTINAAKQVANPVATTLVVIDDAPAGPGELPYTALVDEARQAYEETMPVTDVLYTNGETYRSYLCADATCPCISGAQVSEQARTAVQSEFVAAGAAPAVDRNHVINEWNTDTIAHSHLQVARKICADLAPNGPGHTPLPQDPKLRVAMYDNLGGFVHKAASISAVESTRSSVQFDTAMVDVLARAEHEVKIRDALIAHSSHLPPEQNRALANQIRTVAAAMPVSAREAAAVLAATNYYLAGDGVRATIACDVALASNPDSTMGNLLDAAITRGLPPSAYREMLQTADGPSVMGVSAPTPNPPAAGPPTQHPAPSL